MLDTQFMNLGQIDHKLWLLPLFTLFTTFGDETVAKNYTNIFNGFRRGINICLDTIFMYPG